MTGKVRTDLLTTTEMFHLDQACQLVSKAFGGEHPYLVGSAGLKNTGAAPRDIDVRLILDDEEFTAVCPTLARWELLCVAIGSYLSERSGGLKIDFQIQAASIANERYRGGRNPLGLRGAAARLFAGGGDGTPDWPAAPESPRRSLVPES